MPWEIDLHGVAAAPQVGASTPLLATCTIAPAAAAPANENAARPATTLSDVRETRSMCFM
jgi:hypothetical protein